MGAGTPSKRSHWGHWRSPLGRKETCERYAAMGNGSYTVFVASQLSCTCRYRTQARRKQDTYVCTHVRTYLVHPPGTCALISSCERASPPCAPNCAFSFREGHSPLVRPVHLQGKRIRTYICFLIRPPCLLAADRPPLPPVHTYVLGGPEVLRLI